MFNKTIIEKYLTEEESKGNIGSYGIYVYSTELSEPKLYVRPIDCNRKTLVKNIHKKGWSFNSLGAVYGADDDNVNTCIEVCMMFNLHYGRTVDFLVVEHENDILEIYDLKDDKILYSSPMAKKHNALLQSIHSFS